MTIMKLIDKDALVAEIKRLKKEDGNPYFPSETADKYYARGVHFTCDGLVNFLDTLEVKEVDLEKEVDTILEEENYEYQYIDHYKFAKHFFELGLKVKQESNDEVKVGETQIYFNDSREQPYIGKGLDLSCMKYETLKSLFKDGDNVEILIRKPQKGE